jgi:hypothetical protein
MPSGKALDAPTDAADASEDRTAALAMLRAAGLSPEPHELDAVLAGYAGFRMLAARLYEVDEARYVDPAVTFGARPVAP